MTEALSESLLDLVPSGEEGGHLLFLLIFALLMVGVGWLSYRRMLMTERQL